MGRRPLVLCLCYSLGGKSWRRAHAVVVVERVRPRRRLFGQELFFGALTFHRREFVITAEVPDSDKLNVVSYRLILHGGKLVGATYVIVKVITNNDRHGRSCWLSLLLVPSRSYVADTCQVNIP